MPAGLIVLILSMLLGIQPVTTDLYLPALPALTEGFSAPMSQAQLTLSALLLAFGTSQLIWGPLSDRFGRRPILLCGLAAYTLAGFGSTLAPSMEMLIVWRIVQGAAMGAVVMCARAIVRDLYMPSEGARVMSKGLSGLALLACLSAPLGGLLAELYNWRAVLMAPAVFGVLTLALVALRFKETLNVRNPKALQPATLVRTWADILRNPTFLAFSALAVASYSGLFTFLAGSSFVFLKVLGLNRLQYGLMMVSMCSTYLCGTFVCRRLLPRFGVQKSVSIAAVISVTAGTSMGLLALAGIQNVWAIGVPFCLFMLGHGVHQPCGQSGAVGPFPRAAGAASALNGFIMMVAAFLMGGWLGTHMDGTVRPMVNGIWFWSVMIAVCAWTVVRKFGDPTRVAQTPPAAGAPDAAPQARKGA
ncbi:MAG: multidrug effflux MFS transporter [Polaromonas sp.]|nr:multidrug effflux MFS transporter [Polaromonas sp.]